MSGVGGGVEKGGRAPAETPDVSLSSGGAVARRAGPQNSGDTLSPGPYARTEGGYRERRRPPVANASRGTHVPKRPTLTLGGKGAVWW